MTGRASCGMAGFRVRIAGKIEMTAQTATAEQVIGQGEGGIDRVMNRDFRKRRKFLFCAKSLADNIDFIFESEMKGVACLFNPVCVTFAAGFDHDIRVGRFGDQSFMGLLFRRDPCFSSMAVPAGKIVIFVQGEIVAVPASVDRFLLLLLGQDACSFILLILTAGGNGDGDQQEKDEVCACIVCHSLCPFEGLAGSLSAPQSLVFSLLYLKGK